MWACVRRLTGKNQNFDRVEGITAESLNDHYSQISTDRDYTPPASLVFNDQFAFRPSGSTTAAIITLLHKVTHLLLNNPYVIVRGGATVLKVGGTNSASGASRKFFFDPPLFG